MLRNIPCANDVKYNSMAAGAAVAFFSLDRVLPLPPLVHYAAAGIAPLVPGGRGGRLQLPPAYEAMCASLYGIAGAMVAGYGFGKGPTINTLMK